MSNSTANRAVSKSDEDHDESRQTMPSALVASLRSDIVSGALQPGAKLKLTELSARYDSSAIPLREALSRLVSTSLVTSESQKGFRVAPVSIEEIIDITRVRREIECLALRDSIENGDVEWEARVLSAHHRLKRLSERSVAKPLTLDLEWEALHQQFHHALVSGCQSKWLLRFRDMLVEQMARYRHLSIKVWKKPRNVPAEHARIVEAVLARNSRLAEDLLSEHFARTTDIVLATAEWQSHPEPAAARRRHK